MYVHHVPGSTDFRVPAPLKFPSHYSRLVLSVEVSEVTVLQSRAPTTPDEAAEKREGRGGGREGGERGGEREEGGGREGGGEREEGEREEGEREEENKEEGGRGKNKGRVAVNYVIYIHTT